MPSYPYVYTVSNLKRFLETVSDVGTPPKVTQEYLESMGFKSKNDRAIISVLKFIGLIQDDGRPADDYKLLRDKSQSRVVIAAHILKGYSELFAQFPDANLRSNDALKNFFATKTEAGAAALTLIVGTFKALCEKADFAAIPTTATAHPTSEPGQALSTDGKTLLQSAQFPGTGVTINLNIQLQLPATENTSVYNSIFKSLRENLIERKPPASA
jgi:hypothetical protein